MMLAKTFVLVADQHIEIARIDILDRDFSRQRPSSVA